MFRRGLIVIVGLSAAASAGVVSPRDVRVNARSFKTLTAERQTEILRAVESGSTGIGYQDRLCVHRENVRSSSWVGMLADLGVGELGVLTPDGSDHPNAVLAVRDLLTTFEADAGLRIAELVFDSNLDVGNLLLDGSRLDVFDASSWGWQAQRSNPRDAGLASRKY